eukprot:2033581-Rhodomonas_salina.1
MSAPIEDAGTEANEGGDSKSFKSFFAEVQTRQADETRLRLCGFINMDSAPSSCGCTFTTSGEGRLSREGNCSTSCKAFDLSDKEITSIDAKAFQGM